MDTVFTIIDQNRHKAVFGADHFGFEDLYLKAVDILTRQNVSKSESTFIAEHLYRVEDSKAESSDIIIDYFDKQIYLLLGFVCKEYKTKDVSDLIHVNFDRIDLMIEPKPISFEEFQYLYKFFLSVVKYDEVVINDKYIYHIDKVF